MENMEQIDLGKVSLVDGSMVQLLGKGLIRLNSELLCLFVPALEKNLISVNKLVQSGFNVNFNPDGCSIIKSDTNITFKLNNDIYVKDIFSAEISDLLHYRMGHVDKNIKKNGKFNL